MELRPYQQEAFTRIFEQWDKGMRRVLLVLPTGTGKTIVFAKVAAECVRRGQRVLILAHRGELLDQAADKIRKATGLICSVEKAEQTSEGSWYMITVGSVQTLCRAKRLSRFRPDHFGTIIIDEAHHAISDSYQVILSYFAGANVLGVTATPDRGDMKNLGQYFEALAYEYTLPKAIKQGFLSKIRAQTIPLKLDISEVGVSAGDFKAGDVGHALDPYLEEIAQLMPQYCLGRKTVVFLPLVATSQKLTGIINSRRNGLTAREVNGNSEDRAETLRDFDEGKFNVLCNSMLLTEGWDCPSVDCIIVLKPTKSRSLYCQMVGRGTRLSPGKDHLLLLDFLWMTSRHSLCRPASLICKDEEVAEAMTRRIENDAVAEPMDIGAAEEAAMSDVVEQREASLAKELAAMRKRKAKYVDPVQFAMSIADIDLSNYVPPFAAQQVPPTQSQRSALEGFGILPDSIRTTGEAEEYINRLVARKEQGLSTAKQIRFLEGKGFRHVGQWTFSDASALITRISANNWRTPPGISPVTYIPPGGLYGAAS